MTPLRRIAFPVALARARLAHRSGRAALVVLGIAAGAAVLTGVVGGSTAAQDRSVARATARIPGAERSVRAVWFGVPGQSAGYGSLDRTARRALDRLGRPFGVMLLRQTQVAGTLVDLTAIDGVSRFVRLRSGRLPKPCGPKRCEVIQIGGTGPLPATPDLRLIRVGRATLESPVPFGHLLSAESTAAFRYHSAAAPPFLLAEGVRGLADSPVLQTNYRIYSWVLPVAPGSVHSWDVDAFTRNTTRARADLGSNLGLFELTAPTAELEAAGAPARVAARRLLLIGGEAAALLLAFTLLAAVSLRRDVEAAWRRFTWLGARRWQLVALTAAESAAVAAVGTALGYAAGIGLAVLLARRLGAPPGDVLAHSVASWPGIVAAMGLAALATAVLVAALRARGSESGQRRVGALDVAAIGALAVIAVSVARGAADADRLAAEGGTGAFLLLLPLLVGFVAAVAAARLSTPLLRALERLGRAGPVSLRLAALSLARSRERAAVTVGFLVVSLGVALFALSYGATLERGQREQAAYAVPADFVLREDLTKLAPVPPVLAQARRAGIEPEPVLRLSGDVSRLSGVTVLGLAPRRLAHVDGWRDDFSPLSRDALARTIDSGSSALLGVDVRGRELVLPVVVHGDAFTVRANLLTRDGLFAGVSLGTARPGRTVLRAELPAGAVKLVALTFGLADTGLHEVPNAGVNFNPVATGTATLGGPLSLDGWVGTNGITGTAGKLRYLLTTQEPSRFRAAQPTDGRSLEVAASPALADAAGSDRKLPLEIAGNRVTVHVAATLNRFPSVDGPVVLADGEALATMLNADAPGTAVTNELWLDNASSSLREAVRLPPFDVLRVTSRAEVEHQLRSEPLSRGTLITLAAAALTALALALVGLVLGVVADVRDERGELHDLEAQGADPRTLRRHLRLRALAVAGLGVAGGVGTGVLLSALVVSLVKVTAGATAPQPPLRALIPWELTLLALVAFVAVAAVLVAVVAANAFRGREAGRFAEAG